MNQRYLPPDLNPERVVACLGLISDTHMPDRWAELPPAIFDALEGVDMVLHAGDVGELRVLDQLSEIAPVVAVHGNDEKAMAPQALPYQQLLTIAGTRLLLCHSHFPERQVELASRKIDEWQPKLAARAEYASRFGAHIYVSGHLHIPFVVEVDGVWLINPGAIASGGATVRQAIQTIAILYLRDDGRPFVVHVEVSGQATIYATKVDWTAGFTTSQAHYSVSILADELQPVFPALRQSRFGEDIRFWDMMTLLGRPVWAGDKDAVTLHDLREALHHSNTFTAEERVLLLGMMNSAPVE